MSTFWAGKQAWEGKQALVMVAVSFCAIVLQIVSEVGREAEGRLTVSGQSTFWSF